MFLTRPLCGNRWLVWAFVFVLTVAIGLVGFIQYVIWDLEKEMTTVSGFHISKKTAVEYEDLLE